MSVYFVKCNQFIKIGYSNNPLRRLSQIQVSNPYQIEVLAIIPGDTELERELQHIHRDTRVKGEWFRESDCLLSNIAILKTMFSDYEDAQMTKAVNGDDDSDSDEEYKSVGDIAGDGFDISPTGKKANLVRYELAINPNRSDIEIASIVGCSRVHVWCVRNNRPTGSPDHANNPPPTNI